MTDKSHAPACGLFCGDCGFLGNQCKGCGNEEGRPFWTAELPAKICPIYDCCTNEKKLEHCGLCEELPCRTFLELRDPSMSDEEFENSMNSRKQALERRKAVGTPAWLAEIGQ